VYQREAQPRGQAGSGRAPLRANHRRAAFPRCGRCMSLRPLLLSAAGSPCTHPRSPTRHLPRSRLQIKMDQDGANSGWQGASSRRAGAGAPHACEAAARTCACPTAPTPHAPPHAPPRRPTAPPPRRPAPMHTPHPPRMQSAYLTTGRALISTASWGPPAWAPVRRTPERGAAGAPRAPSPPVPPPAAPAAHARLTWQRAPASWGRRARARVRRRAGGRYGPHLGG
jgi:hypothetical protein